MSRRAHVSALFVLDMGGHFPNLHLLLLPSGRPTGASFSSTHYTPDDNPVSCSSYRFIFSPRHCTYWFANRLVKSSETRDCLRDIRTGCGGAFLVRDEWSFTEPRTYNLSPKSTDLTHGRRCHSVNQWVLF